MNSYQPLNVTFVITSMPVGGAETLLVNLMRRFDRSRVVPDVVCLKQPGPLGEQIAREFDVASGMIGGKWDLLVIPRLISHFRRQQTDVVITVGAGDKMFWGRLAAKLAGVCGIAAALHSTGWPGGVGRLNRFLTGITDAFIAVADSHGSFLCEFERFPASKINVIRNGIDCDRFKPDATAAVAVRNELNLPLDSPLVGIVAALRPEKNHAMFVRMADQILKTAGGSTTSPAHFIIIGDGPERSMIESLAAELGIQSNLHLLGSRADTPRLLAAMNAFVLCSLNEASPVSILESLACGVPVVATDVGSISETVIAGKTGALVASEDLPELVAEVQRLLADPPRARRIGSAGRAWVKQTGSLDSMVNGYTDLIEKLCGRSSKNSTSSELQSRATSPSSRPAIDRKNSPSTNPAPTTTLCESNWSAPTPDTPFR